MEGSFHSEKARHISEDTEVLKCQAELERIVMDLKQEIDELYRRLSYYMRENIPVPDEVLKDIKEDHSPFSRQWRKLNHDLFQQLSNLRLIRGSLDL